MKQNQKGQQGQDTKTGKKQNLGKAGTNSPKNIIKNNAVSSGDTPEEPTTPATPTTPRREYEDPGHEHVHHPPTDNPSSPKSLEGFVGE